MPKGSETMTDLEVKQELRKIKELVLAELEADSRCRNDDLWLLWKIWRKFSPIYIPFEDFQKLPSFESVRRCRQLCQAKGLFLPTDEMVLKRRRREKSFRRVVNQV